MALSVAINNDNTALSSEISKYKQEFLYSIRLGFKKNQDFPGF